MDAASINSGNSGLDPSPAAETLLVADDEESVRTLAGHILRRHGYTVMEASNGREALEMVEKHEGSLEMLVSDVQMPVMGGRELAEALLKLRPGIKVLLLSGYTDDGLVRNGVIRQQYAFLPKPFTPNELVRCVRQILDHD
jgi:two-component system, cell cycle sensor histidine kinase and response regulator CckA